MIDSVWILFCVALVMFMQVGFTCLEAGLTRSKNSINVALKNFADFCLSIVLFALIGFSLMFGESVDGFYGTVDNLLAIDKDHILLFLYQTMFLATASTLISGAVAERMRFKVYLLVVAFMGVLVYPVLGHWVWGTGGWLQEAGFYDMAGGTVVHALGGAAALAALLVVGPRDGVFSLGDDGKVVVSPVKPSNVPLAVVGGLIIWVGWLGFNGGAQMGLTDSVPHILMITVFAGAVGGTVVVIFGQLGYKKMRAATVVNGALAGLVSITACADIIGLHVAALVSALAVCLMLCVQELFDQFAVDDAVGVVSVHLLPGVLGTLIVGVVGAEYSFIVQLKGVAVVVGVSFISFYVFLFMLKRFIMPIRVSVEEESIGMNVSEHGEAE